jgi:hypothetical protein
MRDRDAIDGLILGPTSDATPMSIDAHRHAGPGAAMRLLHP